MRFLVFISLLVLITGCSTRLSSTTMNRRIDTRVDLALAYLKKGNFDRAVFHLQRAEAISPSNIRYQLTTTYYYELTGQYEKALHLYSQLLEKNKFNPNVLNNFAQYQCRQSNFTAAETLFNAGIENSDGPFTGIIYKNAGLCALQNNATQKAKKKLTTAQYYWPNDPEIESLLKQIDHDDLSVSGTTSWSHSSF